MTANNRVVCELISNGWCFDAAGAANCIEWLRGEAGMPADYLCTRNQVHLFAIGGQGLPALCGVKCEPPGWRRHVVGRHWYVPPLGIDHGVTEGKIHQEMVRFLFAVSAYRFRDVSEALRAAAPGTAGRTVVIGDEEITPTAAAWARLLQSLTTEYRNRREQAMTIWSSQGRPAARTGPEQSDPVHPS